MIFHPLLVYVIYRDSFAWTAPIQLSLQVMDKDKFLILQSILVSNFFSLHFFSFSSSPQVLSQDTYMCGMLHSLSEVFNDLNPMSTYTTLRIVYISFLEIFLLNFPKVWSQVSTSNHVIFCPYMLNIFCSFSFLTSGSLEIHFFIYYYLLLLFRVN